MGAGEVRTAAGHNEGVPPVGLPDEQHGTAANSTLGFQVPMQIARRPSVSHDSARLDPKSELGMMIRSAAFEKFLLSRTFRATVLVAAVTAAVPLPPGARAFDPASDRLWAAGSDHVSTGKAPAAHNATIAWGVACLAGGCAARRAALRGHGLVLHTISSASGQT